MKGHFIGTKDSLEQRLLHSDENTICIQPICIPIWIRPRIIVVEVYAGSTPVESSLALVLVGYSEGLLSAQPELVRGPILE